MQIKLNQGQSRLFKQFLKKLFFYALYARLCRNVAGCCTPVAKNVAP